MRRKTILVLYYTRGVYPLRDAIRTHLYCWRAYSRHRVVYVNVAFGFPRRLIRRLRIDAVVFHTIFLGMRWTRPLFLQRTAECADLRARRCLKIAMPQDEFINTDLLNEFINGFGVTHLLTVSLEPDWPVIYPDVDRRRVTIQTVLTGYLDEHTLSRIEGMKRTGADRDIDVGYRAWKAEHWLGEFGQHKVCVGDVFQRAAAARNMRTDISLREQDVLAGDHWFAHLLRCRTTIGVEGGASLLDRDGSMREHVTAYLAKHPDATFEQTRDACFPGQDRCIGLMVLSPRHLEAVATETCQVLVEGRYNGILEAGRHYFAVKRDYSNVQEALDFVADHDRCRRMAAEAHRDIVGSGRWTYRRFVAETEQSIIDPAATDPGGGSRLADWWTGLVLLVRDWLTWRVIEWEVKSHAGQARRLERRALRLATRYLPKWFA
jgi:hypothetical protein